MTLRRSSPLKRTASLTRRTPVKKRNAKRADKRAADYRKYLAGPVWRVKRAEAMERAGHRCEVVERVDRYAFVGGLQRCGVTEGLETHHLRYPRELGTESLDTLLVVCKAHHDHLESAKWWKRHD